MSEPQPDDLLSLAEDVAAGRLTRTEAAASAAALSQNGPAELDDLLFGLDAVMRHARATHAAEADAATLAGLPRAKPRLAGMPGTRPWPAGAGSGRIPRVDSPLAEPRGIVSRRSSSAARRQGSRRWLITVAAAAAALAIVAAGLNWPFAGPRRQTAGTAGPTAPVASAQASATASLPTPSPAPSTARPSAVASRFVSVTAVPGAKLTDVTAVGRRYIVVGTRYGPGTGTARTTDGAAWISDDGNAWNEATDGALAGGFVFAVAARADGTAVAVGSTGSSTATADRTPAIWLSLDGGATWRVAAGAAPAETGGLRAITLMGSEFVAVGTLGSRSDRAVALTSADGSTWHRAASLAGAAGAGLTGVTTGGPGVIGWGYQVTRADRSPAIWISGDGQAWSLANVGTPAASPDGGVQTVISVGGSFVAFAAVAAGGSLTLRSTGAKTWLPLAADGLDGFDAGGSFATADWPHPILP